MNELGQIGVPDIDRLSLDILVPRETLALER
jgi:hypothetical protein